MENLLKPDLGLMFWTVLTFLIMVIILKKVAWGPMLQAIEERESSIQKEIETARKHREDSEKFKADYESRLNEIEARTQALLSEAENKGRLARETILKEAESEARNITDKTRRQLELEKDRLVQELRAEVGQISLLAAEKLIGESVDKKVQDKFLQGLIDDAQLQQTGK